MHRPRMITGAAPLVALLVGAMLVRLPLLLTPGYDVRDYREWARVVDQVGIGGAYSAAYPSSPWLNYPPLYPWVLKATGTVYTVLRPDGDWGDQLLAALVKLSPVLAEIATGALLYRFVRGYMSCGRALVVGAAYLFNPALIWNSAYWGGIDALHSLFLAAALFTAGKGRARAWPLAAAAVCAKLLALPGALATVPPVVRGTAPRRLALGTCAAVAVCLLLAAPVIVRGEVGAMLRAMFQNVGNIPAVSANAHNLWWLLTRGDGWRMDTTPLIVSLDYRQTGYTLFGGVAVWTLAGLWRRAGDAVAVCATGGFLTYAFFMLTTEVHENWGMALFAPLAAAMAVRPAYRPLFVGLTATALANLALHDPPLREWLGGDFDLTAHRLGLLNAGAACALFGWWAALLVRVERFPIVPRLRRGRAHASAQQRMHGGA